MRSSLILLAVALLAGCGPGLVIPPNGDAPALHDAGLLPARSDAGGASTGDDDGGPFGDGGSDFDAGAGDAGDLDAGPADAGDRDAGSSEDAGERDAGGFDAGPIDAGEPPDAGSPDAGSWLDIDAGPSSSRQTAHPLGTTTAPNGFYEYLPPGYGDGTPRPLIVFWHGIGEDGNGTSDLSKVLANGPPKLIAHDQWPADRPFIVLSPQNPWGCPQSQWVSDFITWARANYDVDPRRVYLSGLSCGAIGSWAYLGDHATDGGIAAALFSSGDPGDPNQPGSAWRKQGCALGQVAIWAIHGTADGTVNINNEQSTMNDLLACPSRRDAVWMPITGGGHNVWDDLYAGNDGDVYAWLLANPLP